jgi:beta-lactamase superfamily II metal-dependent hydrolase
MRAGIRIRMYRVGFGDCFLLSLPIGRDHQHILIDCGAHIGDLHTVPRAVADIAKETSRRLALVIATHNHKDHVSGFATCQKEFSEFHVGEVWLPWTADPEDDEARRLREKQEELVARLALSLRAAGDPPELAAVLDNFPWQPDPSLDLGKKNRAALDMLTQGFQRLDGKKGPPPVRYLAAGKPGGVPLTLPPVLGTLKATLLAPSRTKAFIAMMDPPKDYHYLTLAMGSDKKDAHAPPPLSPFEKKWRVPPARYLSEKLWPPDVKSTLSAVLPDDLVALTRWLDDAINNTSLVVHFSLKGKNLLFTGDAQWGNWLSWMYTEGDTARGLAPHSRNLLAGLDFLKVAHHGSVNATPTEVVANLPSKAAVMCSTHPTITYPQVPLQTLIDAFDARTDHQLALSDQIDIPGNAQAHEALRDRALSSSFKRGPFWIDYTL